MLDTLSSWNLELDNAGFAGWSGFCMVFVVSFMISIQGLTSQQTRRATTEVCWKKQREDTQASAHICGFYSIVTV